MGSRGPKGEPDNVRELRGNPGKRAPQPTVKAVPGVPEAPEWLSEAAKAEWERVSPELARIGVLSRLDRGALTSYCFWWAVFEDLASTVMALEESERVVDDNRGSVKKNPLIQQCRDASDRYQAWAQQCALTPAARGRMRAPESEPGDDADLD